MKITLCGSIAFYDEMLRIQKELETFGHLVKLPLIHIADEHGQKISVQDYYNLRQDTSNHDSWVWDRKSGVMREHLKKIEWADIMFVTNFDKNNIAGYIGGNTLIEMGIAFYLNKKIFLLRPIPEISYKEEILGMKPIVISSLKNL